MGDLSGDLGPDLIGLDVCVHVSPGESHQREFGYISMRAPRISAKSVKVMVLGINDFQSLPHNHKRITLKPEPQGIAYLLEDPAMLTLLVGSL